MDTIESWIEANKHDIKKLQNRKWDLDFQVMDADAAEMSLQGQIIEIEVARDRSEEPDVELEKKIRELRFQRREQEARKTRLRSQLLRVDFALKHHREEVKKARGTRKLGQEYYQTHDPND